MRCNSYPIGRYGGVLAAVRPDDLAAIVLYEILPRNPVEPVAVDDVILSCANQAGEHNRNIAPMAGLFGWFPAGCARGDHQPSVRLGDGYGRKLMTCDRFG